jgi:serine/threonine protein kinase
VALTTGTRLGPYEIVGALGALGAGGMGEVYRARDTKLKREVPIKVLPAAFAQDSERIALFEGEAVAPPRSNLVLQPDRITSSRRSR